MIYTHVVQCEDIVSPFDGGLMFYWPLCGVGGSAKAWLEVGEIFVAVHRFGSKSRMSLNFSSYWRESQQIDSRATLEQLEHFTPLHAFDSSG